VLNNDWQARKVIWNMKKLSLKFKLYVFVISLLLVMGVSMVITSQVSLSQMEGRLVSETSQLVQRIVMDRLSAPTGESGEEISGQLNAALKVPDVVRSIIEQNIAAGSSSQISRSGLSDAVRAVLTSEGYLIAMYAKFEPDMA
jgi:methyl-accepting chemotaxis protein